MFQPFNYSGKIVKQGNSLCVRVPNIVKKSLNLKEGVDVMISIRRTKYEFTNKHLEYLLKLANNVKKLDKFGEEKKRLYIHLNFRFVEKVLDKSPKTQDKFIEQLRKEFGNPFINEWLEFEKIFEKEAVHTDKEGYTILKDYYQKIMDQY